MREPWGAKDKNVIERHPVVSTIIGTVLLAAIGGLFTLTYNTGYNGGAKDYEAVSDFKKLDLPTLMKDLGVLAKDFRERSGLMAENQRLAKEVAEKDTKLQQLTKEVTTLRKQADEFDAATAKLFPTDLKNVTISEGTAERVIPNAVTVGIDTVYGTAFIDMRVNGSLRSMVHAGEKSIVNVGKQACVIEVMKISKPSADFVVYCYRE
jgi:Sec-independent protein translocase protein TatA